MRGARRATSGTAADDHRTGRRYAAAAHLRGLFRSYGAHRPAMLVDWAAGQRHRRRRRPLDDDLRWQAELWRRLRARLGAPSPAERLDADLRAAARRPGAAATCPSGCRCSAPTRLTTDAARGAARARRAPRRAPVAAAPEPGAVAARCSGARRRPAPRRRHAPCASATRCCQPRPRRPRAAAAARRTSTTSHHPTRAPAARRCSAGAGGHPRRRARPTPAATRRRHACRCTPATARPRQVEVLREVLLAAVRGRPDARAARRAGHVPRRRDVRAADLGRVRLGPGRRPPRPRAAGAAGRPQSLRQTNPLLDTVAGAARARRRPGHRQPGARPRGQPRRCGAGSGSPTTTSSACATGSARSGVRWGLGRAAAPGVVRPGARPAEHLADRPRPGAARRRRRRGRPGVARPARCRSTTSTAATSTSPAGSPSCVDRLDDVLRRAAAAPQPLRALGRRARRRARPAHRRRATPTPGSWRRPAASSPRRPSTARDAVLRLADVRALLADRLRGRPTRANFRTGELTVCTMVPMRSVPHRVVALLGLDDGVFPRGGGVDGDDVLARDPCVGERDLRSEDRQLLLDALMSAGDHAGAALHRRRPGHRRPRGRPRCRSASCSTSSTRRSGGAPTRASPGTRCSRSTPATSTRRTPFSFDRGALAGARAALRPRAGAGRCSTAPAAARAGRRRARRPGRVRSSTRPRRSCGSGCGVTRARARTTVADALRADARRAAGVGGRRPAARRAAAPASTPADFRQAEWRRGTLPPGRSALRC